MSPIRYREEPPYVYAEEEESSSRTSLYIAIGAAAGFAAGVLMAERFGGFKGLTGRLMDRFGGGGGVEEEDFDYEGLEDDEFDPDFDEDIDTTAATVSLDADEELEERVLEAYRNDPTLSERAVDIGAVEEGIIELTGWVNSEEESHQAVAVARGVPGVETVVNRLAVRTDEDLFDEAAHRYEDGDPVLTERHWEGQQVGTGRRRQGNSTEIDRHADPRNVLEDRSLREDKAFMAAAEDIEETAAERRKSAKKAQPGGRTDGSPIAPTGVPKADHVADPEHAPVDVPRPRP
ncbi:MAG TPA: BON domain-containing protein, partial [Gemmatimonadaceae bacterium]|nr:BON domain-containing protein [Gemmatimonadaceae bacterium]